MSEADLEDLCDQLFAAGCTLVPDVLSEQPQAYELNSIARAPSLACEKEDHVVLRCFIRLESCPFEWGQVEKDERTQFFIRQKTGGPTLDIFAPLPFESPSGRTTLPHGSIAYHSTFWNPLTNRNEKPSESLKALYIRLLKQLRSGANQLKGKHRVYLVGKGAQEMLRTGCLLGPPFDNTAGDIPET